MGFASPATALQAQRFGGTTNVLVRIDDQPLAASYRTFGEALGAAVDQARSSGRVVVRVLADGVDVPDAALENPGTAGLHAGELSFVTADPRELVVTSMRQAEAQLTQVRELQRTAAEQIDQGKPELVTDALSECIVRWQAVHTAVVQGCQLLGFDIAREHPGVVEELGGRLRVLKASLGSQDWSRVSDVLGYDLDETAANWQRVIASIVPKLEGVA